MGAITTRLFSSIPDKVYGENSILIGQGPPVWGAAWRQSGSIYGDIDPG